MKELLKLLPVLGLVSLLGLAVGCAETASIGDDTPPPEGEDGYDGGGAETQPEGDAANIKSPDFKGGDTDKEAPKE